MSDDLVKRLRAIPVFAPDAEQLIEHEAADEIERLRAALKLAQSLDDPLLLEIERQRARIAALEEALNWYGEHMCEFSPDYEGESCGKLNKDDCAGCVAHAALAKGEVK